MPSGWYSVTEKMQELIVQLSGRKGFLPGSTLLPSVVSVLTFLSLLCYIMGQIFLFVLFWA